MARFGFCGSLPITDRKKPAGISSAAIGTNDVPMNRQMPSSCAESITVAIAKPSTSSTAACAWPARKKFCCSRFTGTWPRTTRVRK
jgi:hypothetical protein